MSLHISYLLVLLLRRKEIKIMMLIIELMPVERGEKCVASILFGHKIQEKVQGKVLLNSHRVNYALW